jgi:hypothetical protein
MTIFLLLGVTLSAQKAEKPVKPTPKLKMTATLVPEPVVGTVSLVGDNKVILSLDGTTKITIPRVDLSKPTLTATVSGNTYTYTLANAADARQKIDMLLFPDANFVSIAVNDPVWITGPGGARSPAWITTTGGISAVGGGLLPGGKSLTFTAVAAEGTVPGLTRAEAYAFVAPSQATAQAIHELETKNPKLADLVAKESGRGLTLQVLGPQP